MFEYIDNLRKKTPDEKRMISLVVSLVVTGIIALIWMTTLPVRFSGVKTEVPEESTYQFETISIGFKNVVKQVQSSIGNIKEAGSAYLEKAK